MSRMLTCHDCVGNKAEDTLGSWTGRLAGVRVEFAADSNATHHEIYKELANTKMKQD